MVDKKITIRPITRIEGHAQVTILLNDDDSVKEALFNVTDFRGFEKFTEGRPFYELPAITSRACGICPVSHLLASVKACDQIVGVNPSKTVVMLRRLMHMGQLIQSHALNFFHLSSPDLLLGFDSDPHTTQHLWFNRKEPRTGKTRHKTTKIRTGNHRKVAGKKIHSSEWVLPGGAKWPLTKERADYLRSYLPEALDATQKTLEMWKHMLDDLKDEVDHFGNFQTYYMSQVTPDGGLEHYDGKIRILDPHGKVADECIDPTRYSDFIGEAVEPWSYRKFPYYKAVGYPNGAYRVGPLARLNVAQHCGTPLAGEELKWFKKLGRNGVVESTFHYHTARLIEILFCIETAKQLLEDRAIQDPHVTSKATVSNFEGVGVAEAPRGTLIHHYKTDEQGMITWNNMIIATEHSNIAYNMAVTQVAKKYVKARALEEGMLNRVEAVIRAFDPCLSCATHAVGQMPLEIKLIDSKSRIVDRKMHQ
jgi:NAD-reducing hydrogenase large subunit